MEAALLAWWRLYKNHRTQVGRALDRLGIEHIAAYSPKARGRSERMFGALQDRLEKLSPGPPSSQADI